MFLLLLSHIQSTFIRSKIIWSAISLLTIYCLTGLLSANDEWVLSGTYINGEHQQAMFVDGDGNELLLVNGEALQGCKLVEVYPESAMLACNDVFHRIHLRNSVGEIFKPTRLKYSVKKEKYFSISKQATQDLFTQRQRLVTEISFTPIVEDDQMIGVTVSKIRPNTQAAKLGLNNGDIIKSVNGVSASQPEEFFQAIKQLGDLSQVSLEINRYGQVLSHTYVLE